MRIALQLTLAAAAVAAVATPQTSIAQRADSAASRGGATLPLAGGKATRITDGLPFDAQPRWSPDGKQIVYVTDRDGSDDVWVMDADGKNARQITRSDRTQFLSPDFTPDGKYIVVSRNAVQYGTQYSLYLSHKDGGTGFRMTWAATPA